MSRRKKPNSRRPGAAQQPPWRTATVEVTKVTPHPETNSTDVNYVLHFPRGGSGYSSGVEQHGGR